MAGLSAFGTIFTLGSTATVIGNLTGISGPGISVDTIDVTSHDSAAAYRQFVAGLIDGGEISLEGNLVTAAAGNIFMTAINARTTTACSIILPTTSQSIGKWTFSAVPTGFETDAPYDGKIGFSASLKVTGQPVLSS
jgi:predicted secreted protein